MSLTEENGKIVPGAESYVSVADCTTYHANRGNSGWTGTDAVKEAALRKAAAYLDGEYRRRWKGCKAAPITQAMEWPRYGVTIEGEEGAYLDYTTIPQRLKDAQCELALRSLSGELAPDTQGVVKREKVDVLETEYFPGTDPGRTTYRVVEQLLSDLVNPKGSSDVMRG